MVVTQWVTDYGKPPHLIIDPETLEITVGTGVQDIFCIESYTYSNNERILNIIPMNFYYWNKLLASRSVFVTRKYCRHQRRRTGSTFVNHGTKIKKML